MPPIIDFLFTDPTIFVTFVASASDKKKQVPKVSQIFLLWAQFEKKRGQGIFLSFSNCNN